MNKKYLILLNLIVLLSCNRNHENDIELQIINENLYSYYVDFEADDFDFSQDSLQLNNIIKFSLKNNSNNIQVLSTFCDGKVYTGCSGESFPKPFTGLSYNNLLVKNSSNELIKIEPLIGYHGDVKNSNLTKQLLINNYYDKIRYKSNDDYDRFLNRNIKENMIIIYPEETLFFETFVSFPKNKPSLTTDGSILKLQKEESYKVSLVFFSDTTLIKENLSATELENFTQNNYKLFQGTIVSENNIPLIIKKKVSR